MIDKFIDYIGIEKLSNYTLEIIDCYFKPAKFFKKLSSKKLKEKIVQTIFYAILVIGLGYALISDITIRELTKVVLYEIASLFWIFVILIFSEIIIAKIRKKKPRYQDIIFFPIIIKLLIAPLQLIFFGIFISNENYNYFLLSNLVIFGLTIYVLFISAFIFHSKKRFITLNIVLNFILINIIFYFTNFISLDDYSTYEYPYVDRIMKERFDKSVTLKEFYTIPDYRVLHIFNKNDARVFYLLSSPYDTVSSGTIKRTIEYRTNIKKNILILDTLELKYKRNKDFFNKLKILCKKIDSTSTNKGIIDLDKIKEKEIVEASKIIDKDSTELYKEYVLELPNKIAFLNAELVKEQIELENLSSNSIKPLRALDYLYPLLMLNESKKNAP